MMSVAVFDLMSNYSKNNEKATFIFGKPAWNSKHESTVVITLLMQVSFIIEACNETILNYYLEWISLLETYLEYE